MHMVTIHINGGIVKSPERETLIFSFSTLESLLFVNVSDIIYHECSRRHTKFIPSVFRHSLTTSYHSLITALIRNPNDGYYE